MPISPIFQDLASIDVPLENLFLDPNNPRFVSAGWQDIADADITSDVAQEDARVRLIKGYGIDKLKANIEVNGYLPIDRVVVRALDDTKYVVLEGNRRICAAKLIGMADADGKAIDDLVLQSLKSIPCLLYTGSEADAAWIFQGLRHISGVVEWSAFNKAKLLVEQMEADSLSLTEVGKRFGLSPFGAGQWVRGFYAFKQAKEESDFVSEVDERSYPYFQELFGRSSIEIREWLHWDEDTYKFADALRFNEFVGWLYPRDANEEDAGSLGQFDNRRLARRDDMRLLATLIKDGGQYFQQFRNGLPLEETVAMQTAEIFQKKAEQSADRVAELFKALDDCKKAVEEMPYKVLKVPELKAQFDQKKLALTASLAETD